MRMVGVQCLGLNLRKVGKWREKTSASSALCPIGLAILQSGLWYSTVMVFMTSEQSARRISMCPRTLNSAPSISCDARHAPHVVKQEASRKTVSQI